MSYRYHYQLGIKDIAESLQNHRIATIPKFNFWVLFHSLDDHEKSSHAKSCTIVVCFSLHRTSSCGVKKSKFEQILNFWIYASTTLSKSQIVVGTLFYAKWELDRYIGFFPPRAMNCQNKDPFIKPKTVIRVYLDHTEENKGI